MIVGAWIIKKLIKIKPKEDTRKIDWEGLAMYTQAID